jgi:peptide subunit release factor 1 (eRF1)
MGLMRNEQKTCPTCHVRFIEIDRNSERLLGCIECNQSKWVGSNRPVMELAAEELESLKHTLQLIRSTKPVCPT